MNSKKNDGQRLPEGWVLCKSKSNPGRKYYFNKKTGSSSWTQPQAEQPGCSKDPNKKDKGQRHDNHKQPTPTKNLKRKSDSDHISPSKRKRQEASTPNKGNRPIPEKSHTPKTPALAKNLASSRLNRLRAQLKSEVEKEESIPIILTPIKPGRSRNSPKSRTEHTQAKRVKTKSPNSSDGKSTTTTQSPSSESLSSSPSQSQFYTANKIISSMKAQLPEEYFNKVQKKDTFADIEEGICRQIEYPSTKHPATPPQFSEASKLVSAIKSKLSYKPVNECELATFRSAKDRMDALRGNIKGSETLQSNTLVETKTTNNVLNEALLRKRFSDDAMDVDQCKEVRQNGTVVQKETSTGSSNEKVVLVVDTNIFIHELDVIRNVLNSHIKGYNNQPTLLVPWRVINELDRLKDNNNGNGAICKRAKAAMDYLYKSLPENNRIKGQSLRDSNSHIYPCEIPDDEILNCSLQQAERGNAVILLSNDKNLCNKAMINNVNCLGVSELKSLMENKPQPILDPDLHNSLHHYKDTIYILLANILENEMKAKYDNLWQHVLFKPPPWSLSDVLQCLIKHWIAVFNEVFPRIEHLFTDMKNTLASIEKKDPKALSASEVKNFQELCLDIAQRCQIIPEYMELAKCTVERLPRRPGQVAPGSSEPHNQPIVDAFEAVWNAFSNYCGQLCTSMEEGVGQQGGGGGGGVTWGRDLQDLTQHLHALANTVQGVLSIDSSNPSFGTAVARLESSFKDSLKLISMDFSCINIDNLKSFCVNYRNMLQEACNKFFQLTEVLESCKSKILTNNMG